jgi:hypothetical protein
MVGLLGHVLLWLFRTTYSCFRLMYCWVRDLWLYFTIYFSVKNWIIYDLCCWVMLCASCSKSRSPDYACMLGNRCYSALMYSPQVGALHAHCTAVKNILKYLRRTRNMFCISNILAIGYTNASFTTDPDDFKSQLGYVFTLKGARWVGRVPRKIQLRIL